MKKIIFVLTCTFILNGCYSGIGLGIGTAVGEHGGVGTNIHIGSDGQQVHGSVGIGGSL